MPGSAVPQPASGPAPNREITRRSLPAISAQAIAGMLVAVIVGVLVLYPIFFLLQAALDVGDPDVRPPTAYGLGNFVAMGHYAGILGNTVAVSLAATAMAVIFGFVTAWILSRTNVPYRRTLEQLMAVPYYVTPLLGRLPGVCSARRKAASSTNSGARWAAAAR